MSYLESALDYGIKEADFWDMTLAELERYVASYNRVKKIEEQEKAVHNYILADLIGRSMARLVNSNNTMPDISEVYPSLFEDSAIREKREEKQQELSAIRFKLFANSFNKRFRGEQK